MTFGVCPAPGLNYDGRMFKPADLFDLAQTGHAALFDGRGQAWEALKKLKACLDDNVRPVDRGRFSGRVLIGPNVFIGENTVIEDGVVIKGPAIIGANCEIRHNAYIREYVVIGDECVVGNACEIKHSLLFNGCHVPHFNYVGDSILGHRAHLGAGVKISNVKLAPGTVRVEVEGAWVDTGLRKFGALVGDRAEIGCNSVLNPGSIIGRDAVIYPNTSWRGFLPADHIAKNKAPVEVIRRGALPR
jgi:NDP-sugar pyrophosphorylase family protein